MLVPIYGLGVATATLVGNQVGSAAARFSVSSRVYFCDSRVRFCRRLRRRLFDYAELLPRYLHGKEP